MKRISIALLGSLLIQSPLLFAQNISSTFNPKVGSTYFVYNNTNYLHTTGSSGVNQIYDFNDVPLVSSLGKLTFDGAANNPDPSAFPTATVFSTNPSFDYVWYKTSNSLHQILGRTMLYEGSVGDMVYSDPESISLPLKYNILQLDNTKGEASFTNSGLPVKLFRSGKDSLILDGYGTLKLDNKEKKVNRIKIVRNYVDSAKYINPAVRRKNIVRLEEYQYVGIDEDYPTITIFKERLTEVTQANSKIIISNSLVILRKDNINNIVNSDINGTESIQLIGEQLCFKGPKDAIVSIFKSNGQKIYENKLTNDNFYVNKNELLATEGAMIIIKLNSNISSLTKKITLF
ncbi:MAG: hypothetical protein EAZ07_06770 [Cytophagales bacterium]|nr:MAG: hypothetical protein EAZ07_06770 [Cytophagales bacterium]